MECSYKNHSEFRSTSLHGKKKAHLASCTTTEYVQVWVKNFLVLSLPIGISVDWHNTEDGHFLALR